MNQEFCFKTLSGYDSQRMAAKLQHAPPPRFPMPRMSASSIQAVLHQNPFEIGDIPPPPAVKASTHVSSNSISSQYSNPFQTPSHSRHASESSPNSNPMVFSPVSPLEASDVVTALGQPRAQPRPNNTSQHSTTRMSSNNLQSLDGNPYPSNADEADSKPRKVKVAQDMYAGEMPPGYERRDYQGPLASKDGNKGPCHKCGGNKKIPEETLIPDLDKTQQQSQPASHNSDCHKCGGRKSNPPSSYPRNAMANAQPRPQQQATPRAPPVQSSEAGPSGHRHKCGKCGRKRRPDSVSTTASSSSQQPEASQFSQPGLTIQSRVPQIETQNMPFAVSVEPPTAINERAPALSFAPVSNTGETSSIPQIKSNTSVDNNYNNNGQKKKTHVSRTSSVSSLFRSLSRRKKSSEIVSKGEQDAQDGRSENGSSTHSRLRPNDYVDRPGSPFSFMRKSQEEQSFEMGDMHKSKQPERRNSWEQADESTKFLSEVTATERPTYNRSQSTRTGQKDPYKDDLYLSLPPDQRPGVTRFKSLRTGVNRAAHGLGRSASQIGRSTSLRRLESVKRVPELWYRDAEGPQAEYNTYAY